ncbi:HNH endonuclease [Pseudonocardia sp. RS11V-5]|uniref:HNH endonuclease signature motif containing protein n=1 Tax=Pseudonocardia terrae TaxID=2905831 RepID=UPI001E39ED71|nr:HNH endonuclease signature motif containing protein [Pseudonocardia terrae]MCE3556287.1 HNH endonuclease [Pseudonocardia terrae]
MAGGAGGAATRAHRFRARPCCGAAVLPCRRDPNTGHRSSSRPALHGHLEISPARRPSHARASETGRRLACRPGGKLTGRYDDAALFDAIAAAIDAGAAPRDPDDPRTAAERHAEALAEVCAQVLSRGRLPDTDGRRPQLTITVRLEDLQRRAASASLEFGGQLTAPTLRQLACDAAVIPVVLNGRGVPLDIGRLSRTVPDGLRRAVTTRDGGCAFPGCDRPPSRCEIHHVHEWQHGGPTALHNLVMLCAVHHRLIHHSHWEALMADGLPEFIPPSWIDLSRTPRRRPPPLLQPVG